MPCAEAQLQRTTLCRLEDLGGRLSGRDKRAWIAAAASRPAPPAAAPAPPAPQPTAAQAVVAVRALGVDGLLEALHAEPGMYEAVAAAMMQQQGAGGLPPGGGAGGGA